MNWMLLVAFIVGIAFLGWRENRARKKLWAKRRLENAAALGMSPTEYTAWLESGVTTNRGN